MYGTTLSFANMHNHGALFADILLARREAFHSGRNWNLPETMGIEYDHYDTPVSRWLSVHDGTDTLIAGARLTPSTARSGIYTYLIRDAQNGLLDQMPTNLLFEDAPVEEGVWELTRGFFVDGLSSDIRPEVMETLVSQATSAAREEGIRKVVALLPAAWEPFAPRINLPMAAAGPVVSVGGRDSQAVWIDFSAHQH